MTDEPRILVLSLRRRRRDLARAAVYEFEDAVRGFDDAELVAPEFAPRIRGRTARWIARAGRLAGLQVEPDLRPVRRALERRYDLMMLLCESAADLAVLCAVPGWRARTGAAVCWIGELWSWRIKEHAAVLRVLDDFDQVLVGCAGTVPPLSALLPSTPCAFEPLGLDALGFCPLPCPPVRTIDVYCMGRRSPDTHRALRQLAAERGWHYEYDTANRAQLLDHVDHRRLLADRIRRSRYFVAWKAKVDAPGHTQGQEEFGMRYLEGAAGGAVLLGDRPRSEAFASLFDWPDAVVDLPFGTTRVAEVLDALDADPDRVARIRRDNVVHALRRFDAVWLWERVLARAGLEPTLAMRDRAERLEALARRAEKAGIP